MSATEPLYEEIATLRKRAEEAEADNAKLRAEVDAMGSVIEIMTTYGSGVRLNKALAAYRARKEEQ